MDETLKIIIGTLSGFIIAFFAEPIKIYFQNKAKINYIRLAVYKEISHNYVVIYNNSQMYENEERTLTKQI